MSSRATRPRSRRGRQAPPGELDPVAESSEEAEAAGGNAKPRAAAPRESGRWAAAGPHLAGRTAQEADGVASAPAADAPEGPADLSVFQSLQRALSSLEAAAAAWRRRPAEGAGAGGPGPSAEQEGAGGGAREAARLAEKNAWLRLALQSREDELGHTRAALRALEADKETLQREVQELQDALMRLEPLSPRTHSHAGGSGSGSSSSGADGEPWGGQDSLSLAHPLLRRIRSDSSVHILGSLPSRPLAPEMQILEAQMEQLRGNIEKLKCFNRLLLAVLQGRKGRCESLSMRLSQREAEATALRLALQDSEHREAVCAALLALHEASSGARDLEATEREAWRLLAQEEGGADAAAPRKAQPSPEGSSVDKPTPQEVAALLQGYARRLRQRQALVKTPPEPGPTVEPTPTMPHAEAMVQAMLEAQPGPALPRLEKMEIQRELVATRETLADLMLQLQLVRREKRGLELREAALRAQGPAHALLLEQLQWERAQLGAAGPHSGAGDSSGAGSSEEEEEERPQGPPAVPNATEGGQVGRAWDPERLAQELAASLARAADLRAQLRALWRELEQVAQKGRVRRAQSAELNSDLCKAHSALVLAFRGAHRKQEEQRRKLEEQVAILEARQAEELAALEATARALEQPGCPCPPPPPQLGETLL
ncbi:harmonin-binding protein USHBP1 isoform X2 [Oryctolagus cuniculus]|uniref:harmonin-binding protein USHBP1 isoform X2 n=1 Tax=Oryctolagus cuniculus TaxID=9986 RepID=UPI0038798133